MKRLKFFDKLVWLINIVVAVMLLLSYLLPYVQPKDFPIISVLSLGVPLLIILNILFALYWLLKVRRQLWLSLLVLIIGFNYVSSLYKFSASKQVESDNNFSVMNFNVRLFNAFDWIKDKNLKSEINSFISENNPDIISLQEYRPDDEIRFKGYNKHEKLTGNQVKNGQAIFSKFPIVHSGSVEFPNTSNNAIFADVVKGSDTIRIYNLHLQSMGIDPTIEINEETSKSTFKRISRTFRMQQNQVELFLAHKNKCPYRMIICGDFNNTAYSYVYNEIKRNLDDAFVKAGNGFGKTLDFDFFPVRIDFILTDEDFEVNGFKTFYNNLSDHYPIKAVIALN